MSAFVQACAGDPQLEKYRSPFEDADHVEKRCAILHASVYGMLHLEDGSLPDRQRLEMNFQLAAFLRGDKLSVLPAPQPPNRPKETWSDIRGLLGYDGVLWEMKFRKPLQYRLIGVVPAKDYFVGLYLVSRQGLDWTAECRNALNRYRGILGSIRCTAIKSDNATDAFSNWRMPT